MCKKMGSGALCVCVSVCSFRPWELARGREGERAKPLEVFPVPGTLLCVSLVLHCELGVGWVPGNKPHMRTKKHAGRLRPRAVDACDGHALGETLLEAVAVEEAGRVTWQFLALQGREEASEPGPGLTEKRTPLESRTLGGVRDGSPQRQQE